MALPEALSEAWPSIDAGSRPPQLPQARVTAAPIAIEDVLLRIPVEGVPAIIPGRVEHTRFRDLRHDRAVQGAACVELRFRGLDLVSFKNFLSYENSSENAREMEAAGIESASSGACDQFAGALGFRELRRVR